jgi:hypothetical protein
MKSTDNYPLGTKIIYPNGHVLTLTRITMYPYPELPEYTWEHVLEKPRTKTMVDSHKARIWLAEACASIKVIASELDGLTQDEKFKLVSSLGSRLWRDSEDLESAHNRGNYDSVI